MNSSDIKSNKNNTQQTELDELTYIISHDLQEPLRMINSYLQLLNRKYGENLDEDAKDYINYAVDGASRLKHMMDSLLTYSRIGRKDLIVKKVKLKSVLDNSVQQLQSKYKGKDFNIIDSFKNFETNTDEELMTKMFFHILDNSLKFNHSPVPVVSLSVSENEHNYSIIIKDNGMGIDKEYHGKIFGIFQKLHNHSEYPGTGMGLAITDKISKILRGTIRVDSDAGNGSEFLITLQKDLNNIH